MCALQLVQTSFQLLPAELASVGLSSTITILDIRPVQGYTLLSQMRSLTGVPNNSEAAPTGRRVRTLPLTKFKGVWGGSRLVDEDIS